MDEAAFDEFYAGSFRRLCGQLHAMIGSAEEAADCVQEAFVRAWDHRAELDRGAHPEAWVRTTAYRLAVSRWRRVQRSLRPPDRAASPTSTPTVPGPDHVAVVEALKQLPESQRRTLVLFHVCDLSVADVARELGVAEGTVKARLSRGRAALTILLDPGADELLGERGPEGASHA